MITDLKYNNDEGPKIGNGNTLQFNISKNTSGTETCYIEPQLGWDWEELFPKNGVSVTLNGTDTTPVTISNIVIDGAANYYLFTQLIIYSNDTGGKTIIDKSETEPQFVNYEALTAGLEIENLKYNAGEGPMLGSGNTLQFQVNRNGSGEAEYYIIPTLAWANFDSSDKPEAAVTATLSGTSANITLNGINLTGNDETWLYTRIKIYASKDMYLEYPDYPLWESGPFPAECNKAISNMKMEKKTGGSFIFIHNPETIADMDIIQPPKTGHSNRLIYQQENITGYNSVYISHSTKGIYPDPDNPTWTYYGTSEKPQNKFYYDIDLYNPSGQGDITVSIKKPYDAIKYGWGEYTGLRFLCLDRLYDSNPTYSITIPSGQHRLLYEHIMPQLFSEIKELGIEPIWDANNWSFLGVFFDFTVQSGKKITLSTMAVYDKQHLTLNGSGAQLQAGITSLITVGGAPFLIDNSRTCEPDLYSKSEGRDTTGIDEVTASLSYIIDNNVSDGLLYINNQDSFYNTDIEEKQNNWVAHISPIAASNTIKVSFPSILHSWEYTDWGSNTNKWNFSFVNVVPTQEKSSYAASRLSGSNSYPFKDTILQYYKDRAHNKEAHLPNGLTEADIAKAAPGYGGYGVKHKYIIDIKNSGSARTLKYKILMSDYFAAVTYVKDKNTGQLISFYDPDTQEWYTSKGVDIVANECPVEYGDGRPVCKIFKMVIPAGAHYEIHTINMNSVGTGGLKNVLELGTYN